MNWVAIVLDNGQVKQVKGGFRTPAEAWRWLIRHIAKQLQFLGVSPLFREPDNLDEAEMEKMREWMRMTAMWFCGSTVTSLD
jgi:hypothetical protein